MKTAEIILWNLTAAEFSFQALAPSSLQTITTTKKIKSSKCIKGQWDHDGLGVL